MSTSFLKMNNDNLDQEVVQSRVDEPASLLPWLTVTLLALSLVVLVIATPGGLLTKADMVGYAVCHQIESHSFTIGGRQLPLCARCTGTFLGALVGLFAQAVVLHRARAAEFPPTLILAVLFSFSLTWMVDGLNSYLALVGKLHVYEPRNALRLVTGALNGLTMSALVCPVLNVSLWRRPVETPAIRGLRDIGIILVMEMALIGLVLSRWVFLLYPLALLSAVGVLTLLTSVNSVIALILMGRENTAENWRQAVVPISLGMMLSLIQIGLIDVIRYALARTLAGGSLLQ